MPSTNDFCLYVPVPNGWELLVLDESGNIARRVSLTEWLYCGGLSRGEDVQLIRMLPVSNATVLSGEHYMAIRPDGKRLSLDEAKQHFNPDRGQPIPQGGPVSHAWVARAHKQWSRT